MNFHDSERLAGLLEQAGYEPTDDDADADVLVINTCSVRERAEEKLFSRLGRVTGAGGGGRSRPVVAVAGCVAQQEGAKILRRAPVVDVIVGTHALKQLPALIDSAVAAREPSDRHQPVRGRLVSAGTYPPERSSQGVYHDHRRVQRLLFLLCGAVYAGTRADAARDRDSRGSAGGGGQRAQGNPVARPDCQSLSGSRRPGL